MIVHKQKRTDKRISNVCLTASVQLLLSNYLHESGNVIRFLSSEHKLFNLEIAKEHKHISTQLVKKRIISYLRNKVPKYYYAHILPTDEKQLVCAKLLTSEKSREKNTRYETTIGTQITVSP